MVRFALNVAADFDNVLMLEPHGGVNNPDLGYQIKIKCSSCQDLIEKEYTLRFNDAVPVPSRAKKPKSYIHFQRKCKQCGVQGMITMIPGRGFPLTNALVEAGKKACLMVFGCSGLEPVEFNFSGFSWDVLSSAGTLFKNVELVDGDFVEYDDWKGNCWAMVSNLKSTIDIA